MPIFLIDKIKPKGDGDFAMADADDIAYKGGRLPDFMPEALTQAQYDALVAAGEVIENKPYMIIKEEKT